MTPLKKNLAVFLLVMAIVFLVPIIGLTFSSNPPLARTTAPGESSCASCHSGGSGGTIAISSTSGTYTPGVAQRLNVTIAGGPNVVWGYEMTAVQAAASTTGAGTFAAADANSSVRQGTGANASKSYASQINDAVNTFAVNWTPPATSVGNVVFYAAGISGDGSGDESGDSVAATTLTLTPAAQPNLTLTPNTLSFAYQMGGATPAAKTFSIASSSTALSYTVATSGGSWLSATPASGTTPGTESVSVNPTSLAAGTYNGTVTVTSTGAGNSPQTVAVTLTVTAAPNLTLTPNSLSFAYQIGSATPAAQNIAVGSSGAALSYTVATSGGSWLSATPASGTTPGSESVSVNPAGLGAGTYNGTVTVTAAGAGNSPQTVAVTLTVTAAPNLTLTPNTLSFAYQIGGATPAAQTVAVASSAGALSYTVATSGGSWLSATPASSSTPGSESVSVNPTGLAAGTYNGTVTVTSASAGNSPQTVAVTLTVTAAPNLTVTPNTLSFAYQIGGAAPAAKTVAVASSGGVLSYTVATSGGSWLSATPASGSTPGSESVSVNPAGLAAGTYNGTVTVTSTSAGNSPQTVAVTLTVTAAPNLTLTPNTLSFAYQIGGAAPAAQTVAVGSSGAALSYTVAASGGSWLSATPASGTTPGSESVSVNPTGLAAGTYNGTVTVSAAGAGNSPQTAAVTLIVTAAPNLTLTPNTLSFAYQIGGATPAAQNVAVASSGGALSYAVATTGGSWLSATPTSGSTPGSESVSVNPTGLAAGSYNGTVTVSAASAGNSPQTVAVTLTVTAATPNLTVTPSALIFNYQIGGASPAAQSVSLASTGAALSFSFTNSVSFASVTPTSGTTPGTASISVDPTGLGAGTYVGTYKVAATGAANSPQTVTVTLNVTAATLPNLTLSPTSLNYSYQIGGAAPAAQNVKVTTSTGAAVNYAVTSTGGSWLSASPATATSPGTEVVSVNTTGLTAGTYNGTVSVSSTGAANSPQVVAVTLTVTNATPPSLKLSPASLTYSYQIGGSLPDPQSLAVTSTGTALDYIVTPFTTLGGNWLTATPANGTTPGSETIAVDPSGLTVGTYTGTVSVASIGAGNSPQTVPVTLTVTDANTASLVAKPTALYFRWSRKSGDDAGSFSSEDDGGGTQLSKPLTITSTGGPLHFTDHTQGATWLTVSAPDGTTPATLKVTVNPRGLTAGKHVGQILLSAPGVPSITVSVTITVARRSDD